VSVTPAPSEPRLGLTTGIHPITGPALRVQRESVKSGYSRRTLLRRGLAAAAGLWLVEAIAGTAAFAWPAVRKVTPTVRVGTYDQLILINGDLPIVDGFPAYVPPAKSFVVTIDPAKGRWFPGEDLTGDGTALNVRALSQRCPHLGCRPNPCLEDFWLRCPCHQSRYDRLGIKVAGERFGPAPRGMDRYAVRVDKEGVLFVDTSRITLGPLPIELGRPGLIPPLVENGCV
jgi:cytochrome b6-f complex iron-sulfur subunit